MLIPSPYITDSRFHIFGRRPPYPHLWGFIYIFPFFLEQIKLGGDFTSFRELKDFWKSSCFNKDITNYQRSDNRNKVNLLKSFLSIQPREYQTMMEIDLKGVFEDITNHQRSDNYNKVNLWKVFWVFSLVNNRQWEKQNSNEFLFSWIQSCRGSLFWEDAGILIRRHRFSF